LIGASGLLALDPKSDQRFISTAFAISYGVIVMLAALNPWAWGLPALLVLAGVAMTASNASANGLLQTHAPERIRGQSVSMFMLAMRGGMALGSLLTGLAVHLLGVREALLLNGVVAVMVQLFIRRSWLKAL
jgi:MFS family permease